MNKNQTNFLKLFNREVTMLSTAPGEKSISRREFVHAAGIGTVLSPIVLSGWSAKQKPEKTWRIGIFSKHLQWLGYREMADAAARLGFDHVDLPVRPGGHGL